MKRVLGMISLGFGLSDYFVWFISHSKIVSKTNFSPPGEIEAIGWFILAALLLR